jgi:superoxide reductase
MEHFISGLDQENKLIRRKRMERRNFLKAVAVGAGSVVSVVGLSFGQEYYPAQVDENLWKGINRLKNPQNETVLETLHVPVITAPRKVKAGEMFDVGVAVGKVMHPMGPTHWIDHVQFSIGNEPAGTAIFRSRGYLKPQTKFTVVLDENLKGKRVSLVATLRCNLHGIWQHYVNVEVA